MNWNSVKLGDVLKNGRWWYTLKIEKRVLREWEY